VSDTPGRSGGERTASTAEPIAVIDIGSNSVRLVVYDGATRASTPLFNEKVLCGLGRSLASTGRLGAEGIGRALATLRRFRAIASMLGATSTRILATAAVREAGDGPQFIGLAEQICGSRVEVLSGEREAELAAKGVTMGFQRADGLAGDLGGGSLELIDIGESGLREAVTLPLGGLRLIDETGDRIEKALDLVDARLASVRWAGQGRGRTFYAVGGTWRALAKMHMAQSHYPLRVMHGYAIPTRQAIEYCESLRRTRKLSSLPGIEEISKPRREVLPYGALALELILKRIAPKEVVFSVFGIREGLLMELLSPEERAKDPLLSFCEAYAQVRSRCADHGHELAAWTDVLFAEAGPKETDDERRLRHAACLLSDIGWRAHPDYRGEQSLNVVAHAALSGIDHPGRVFLALSVYFRHAGAGEDDGEGLSHRLKEMVSRRSLKRARILGAAIRTAHMLSIGRSGIIPDAPLSYEPGKLVLTIPSKHAALDGERLRRRFQSLAELLERTPEVRVTMS
jgi:exopolyphosphatase/guanosine-5'-triphosphate,3'-diphosphate pyrophosphatase